MTSDNHVTGPKPCPTCQGKGVYDSYDGDGRAFEFECYTCDGTGRQVSASEQASVHSPQSSEAVERAFGAMVEVVAAYADHIRNQVTAADLEAHPYLPELEDMISDARAAIAALQHPAKEMGWLPIESAPHAMHFLAAKFDEDFGEWIYNIIMRDEAIDRSLTHWRPLPEPPAITTLEHPAKEMGE